LSSLLESSGSPGLEPRPAAEADFNVVEYLHVLRRRWRLLVLAAGLGLSISSIHYAMTDKVYQSTAVIQIERRSLTPLTTTQTPWLEDWWNMEYYPTQYRLLESRGLAERVVSNLRLSEDPYFNAGGKPLRLHRHGDTGAAPSLEDERALGGLANRLRGGLLVEPIRNTQLVNLTYRDQSPEFAAKAANGFAEAFIDWGIENRSTTAGNASSFLTSQIETLKQEIQQKELQLQQVSRGSEGVEFNSHGNVTEQRLESLNTSYSDALRNRIQKEAHYRELSSAPKETVAATLTDGVLAQQMEELYRMQKEYESKLKTYKPDFPEMVKLKGDIEHGRQHVDSVVDDLVSKARKSAFADYQSALNQEQALEGEIRNLKGVVLKGNDATIVYNNLTGEIEARRNLLTEMLRAQSETDVTARLQSTRESNIRIVDRALVPGGAASPNLKQDLSSGTVLGLGCGVALILLLEFLDRTLKSSEQVERVLGLPTLAAIPDVSDRGMSYGAYAAVMSYGYGVKKPRKPLEKRKGQANLKRIELVPHEGSKLAVSECYRSLRTALLLSTARELKCIAVTSATAGEGKSATSVNLAVVMAQLGRRVLLIDADLRKPRLHEVLKVSNRTGLVNYLTSGAPLESILVRTEIPQLYLAPSGPLPPNPSELIASERMRELVQQMRSQFDFVVIDTPPALPVTDATLAGALVDGVVLCLRAGKVTRDEARACRDRLRLNDVKILGVVLNRYSTGQGAYTSRYAQYESYGWSGASEEDSAA
jgi:capsular exopolysaccharide synthesis family protein